VTLESEVFEVQAEFGHVSALTTMLTGALIGSRFNLRNSAWPGYFSGSSQCEIDVFPFEWSRRQFPVRVAFAMVRATTVTLCVAPRATRLRTLLGLTASARDRPSTRPKARHCNVWESTCHSHVSRMANSMWPPRVLACRRTFASPWTGTRWASSARATSSTVRRSLQRHSERVNR